MLGGVKKFLFEKTKNYPFSLTMEEPRLFSLPKEILEIIINFVGTKHLVKSESTCKIWQKLAWDSLHTLRLGYANMTEKEFLTILNKTNPLKIRKISLGGNKSLTTSSLMQLDRFSNLYSFQCRTLAASAIQEIVPVLTNVTEVWI
jgi:hypothetical protein